ncbi:DUF6777 domain-containing protein [Streptomyces sp. enrichment culture]|uniref:DUF6777 domain-containing protein n=1 Tax=Streptomyces sp. enrichment culture TaxID=1795815 RepID=UPI003F5680FE
MFDVKAVAAGVASRAPFLDEGSGLGRDADVRSRPAHGGLQQGGTPGLYGGTGQRAVCDVERLERYLTDPRNDRTARAWAKALDLRTDGIPEYLDRLTPVLLRHDTLVKNHDHKKGKAVPFHALLQAGIAVLVDERGRPAVKCSCGNPLRSFEGDRSRISVTFEDGNEKWKGYDRSEVVVVRPAPRKLERIALVDVEDPDRGMERPVGTAGGDDSVFDTRERRAVPSLAGTTFGEAGRRLAERGLAVAYAGEGLPPDRARVTASDPAAGVELRFGAYVTLSVAEDGGRGSAPGTKRPSPDAESSRAAEDPRSPASSPPSSTSPPASASSPPSPSSPSEPTGSERPGTGAPGETPGATPPSSGTPPDGSGPPPPGTGPGTGATPPPPRTGAGDGSPPPAATGPPAGTTASSPPAGDPVTGTAPPPATGAPASSAPAPTGPPAGTTPA